MGGVGVSVIGCACLGVLVYVVSMPIGRGMALVCVKGMGTKLGGGGGGGALGVGLWMLANRYLAFSCHSIPPSSCQQSLLTMQDLTALI